jgi:hypothetical protein
MLAIAGPERGSVLNGGRSDQSVTDLEIVALAELKEVFAGLTPRLVFDGHTKEGAQETDD